MAILDPLRRPTARRTALLGLLLLLVGWQEFNAQSHVHGGADAFGVGGTQAERTKHAPSQGRGDCSLCQIVLGGGAPIPRAVALQLTPIVSLLFILPASRRLRFCALP